MKRYFSSLLLLALSLSLLIGAPPVQGSDLDDDEDILFYRSVVPLDREAQNCSLVFRGWVYEPERSSLIRRILLRGVAKGLGLPSGSATDEMFRSRAEMFLVDSERGERVEVQLGATVHPLPKTRSNGSFHAIKQVNSSSLPGALPQWIRYRAKTPPGDSRRFEGELQLVEPEGIGVISDIDDTIKQTVVLDRSEMLKNTFLRPFKAVSGMSVAYQDLASKGAIFHYVSGSPRQLYPSLVSFLDESGFPRGELHLKSSIWSKGKRGRDDRSSTQVHKIESISRVMALHSGRNYILIGDSGEHDPDIYAEIARRHPKRILKILIRRAPHADESPERYAEVFKDLPSELWSVFTEPMPALDI